MRKGFDRTAALVTGFALLTRAAHLAGYLAGKHSALYYWPVLAAERYRTEAAGLVSGLKVQGGFAFADPAYPYILALSILTGAGAWPVFALQLASSVAIAWMVFRLALTAGSSRIAAVVASLAWSLYAPASFYDLTMLSVTLSTLAVTSIVLLATRPGAGSTGALATSGMLSGMLAGLRPQMLPLALIPLRSGLRRSSVAAVVSAGAVAIPLLLLSWQQNARGGPFSPLASSTGLNLYLGNNPDADGFSPAVPSAGISEDLRRDIHEAAREFAAARGFRTPGEADRFFLSLALDYISAHPGRTAHLMLVKWAAFFGFRPFDSYYEMGRVNRFSPVFNLGPPRWLYICMFAAGLGAFLLEGRHRVVLLAPVVLSLLADILFLHTERYTLPALPAMCAVAAAGLSMTTRAVLAGKARRSALPLAFGAILLLPSILFPVPRIPDCLYYQSLAVRAYQMGEYDLSLELFERSAAASPLGSTVWVLSHYEAARIASALGDADRAHQHEIILESNRSQ